MKNKIGVYGGSFNPGTNGHKFVVDMILSKTSIEKIILNPDGPRLDKDYKIEHHHRQNMIEMFTDDLKKAGLNVEINDYFFSGKNGRDTTIMQVKDYYRDLLGFEPSFIFGTDVINYMSNWKDNLDNYIEKKLSKIFIKRPGTDYDLTGFENYTILETKTLDISSSKVKELLLGNKSQVSELIIPNIRDYILENNLYV